MKKRRGRKGMKGEGALSGKGTMGAKNRGEGKRRYGVTDCGKRLKRRRRGEKTDEGGTERAGMAKKNCDGMGR